MAVYPTAQGYPDFSSDGTTAFIPEIFSGRTQKKFYEKSVIANIANTDWEGEIRNMGDKVNIPTIATISGGDYVKGGKTDWVTPESESIQLVIDKGHYFAIRADNVDIKQMNINMLQKWEEDASQQAKLSIDRKVFSTVYADVPATNQGANAGNDSGDINLGTDAAPLQFTTANSLQNIINAGTVLDENSAPEEADWWMLLPPWATNRIKLSDIGDASMTGDSKSPIRNNGRIGRVDRFQIYNTRTLKTTGTGSNKRWYCLFGTRDAITFASQLTEVQYFDKFEDTFGKGVKGLTVYGFKAVCPTMLGLMIISK